MSVHGEYQRALRAVQTRLAESEPLVSGGWIAKLESAQLAADRDLTTAAQTSLDLLASLEAELAGPATPAAGAFDSRSPRGRLELLRDACHNLRAHCHAILGVSTTRP